MENEIIKTEFGLTDIEISDFVKLVDIKGLPNPIEKGKVI